MLTYARVDLLSGQKSDGGVLVFSKSKPKALLQLQYLNHSLVYTKHPPSVFEFIYRTLPAWPQHPPAGVRSILGTGFRTLSLSLQEDLIVSRDFFLHTSCLQLVTVG